VPLFVYVVGVPDLHIAIGTSGSAVAVSAFANLVGLVRAGSAGRKATPWPAARIR
jgi:uncharacterized protein